jgi:hypothetical protein
MTIPQRARLKSIHWAGRYTCLAALLIVVVAGIMIKTGVYSRLSVYLGVMLSFALMTPLYIGVLFDRKSRIKRMLVELDGLGFLETDASELEADLIRALEISEPYEFFPETLRIASKGIIKDQEVILLELFTEVNDHTTTFTGCAAWVPTEWPETTIRRRTIKDRLSKPRELGDPKFDKQRVLRSEEFEQASDLLLSHSEWFVTKRNQLSSFRMGQPPGKVEQWAFVGHWIVLIDQGSAYTKQQIAMAEFLVAFAEQLTA